MCSTLCVAKDTSHCICLHLKHKCSPVESFLDNTLIECQLCNIKVNILKHRFRGLIQSCVSSALDLII